MVSRPAPNSDVRHSWSLSLPIQPDPMLKTGRRTPAQFLPVRISQVHTPWYIMRPQPAIETLTTCGGLQLVAQQYWLLGPPQSVVRPL